MKAAALLIIMLSNQGYWFGGQEGAVEIRWAARAPDVLPQADLTWELLFGTVRVGGGQFTMKAGDEPTVLRLRPPQVRVRTALKLICRAVARAGGAELDRAEAEISLFPDDLLNDIGHRVGQRQVIVLAGDDGLVKALERAKAPHTRMKDVASLQLQKADIVLVGPSFLDRSPFEQGPLLQQAESGASVLFFMHGGAERLANLAIAERALPRELRWRVEHPLFYDLTADDLASWIRGRKSARAVQLPADEPALEIAYWPREGPGEQPAPIDALIATKAWGKGRVTIWQIPLGPMDNDPRSQILVRNAIDYLLTRAEPTPPPSQRQPKKQAGEKQEPGAIVPRGGQP